MSGSRRVPLVRRVAVGVAAGGGLVTLVGGGPALLLRIGADPVPERLAGWSDLVAVVTGPDDGTLLLWALSMAGWVAWAVITGSLLLEVAARLSGRAALRLPGLGGPQRFAQVVVAGVLAALAAPAAGHADVAHSAPSVVVAGPGWQDRSDAWPAGGSAGESARGSAGEPGEPVPGSAGGRTAGPDDARPGGEPADPAILTYQVVEGDWMWHISGRYLGDERRYPEIAALNPGYGRRHPGFPDHIEPGYRLVLPVDAHDRGSREHATGAIDPAGTDPAGTDSAGTDPAGAVPGGDSSGGDSSGGDSSGGDSSGGDSSGGDSSSGAGPSGEGSPDGAAEPGPSTGGPGVPGTGPWHGPAPPVDPGTSPTIEPTARPPAASIPDDPPPDPSPTGPPRTGSSRTGPSPPGIPDPVPLAAAAAAAGALVLGLVAHRRRTRTRRTVPPPSDPARTAAEISRLDHAMRALAALRTGGRYDRAAPGAPRLPDLVAVWVRGGDIQLVLGHPDPDPPAPFGSAAPDRWILPAGAGLPEPAGAWAPYPTVVTIGHEPGQMVLLDLERAGYLFVTGDRERGVDLLRHLVAELACNPWSGRTDLVLGGFSPESTRGLVELAPDRVATWTAAHDRVAPCPAYRAARPGTLPGPAAFDSTQDRQPTGAVPAGTRPAGPQRVRVLVSGAPGLPGRHGAAVAGAGVEASASAAGCDVAVVLADEGAGPGRTTIRIGPDGRATVVLPDRPDRLPRLPAVALPERLLGPLAGMVIAG